MSKKLIFQVLNVINIGLVLLLSLTEVSNIFIWGAILLLIFNLVLGLFISTDSKNIRSLKVGNRIIEYSGVMGLILSLMGLYTMLEYLEEIDASWFYFLVVNIYILSFFRIKISKTQLENLENK